MYLAPAGRIATKVLTELENQGKSFVSDAVSVENVVARVRSLKKNGYLVHVVVVVTPGYTVVESDWKESRGLNITFWRKKPEILTSLKEGTATEDEVKDALSFLTSRNITVYETGKDYKRVGEAEERRIIAFFTKKMAEFEKQTVLYEINPEVQCGNLGRSRSSMPQIMSKSYSVLTNQECYSREEAAYLKSALRGIGVEYAGGWQNRNVEYEWLKNYPGTWSTKVDVRKLRASQREVKALKSYEIAVDYLEGRFDALPTMEILCAQKPLEGGQRGRPNSNPIYIIDGHHRVFGYRLATGGRPGVEMAVKIIPADPETILERALQFPGVFVMDMEDRCVSG